MKAVSILFLTLFLAFLATPTVVTLIEKSSDVSTFYSFAEEEINKDCKEIKANFNPVTDYFFIASVSKSTPISTENRLRHDNEFKDIFAPPPEIV